MKTFEEKWGWYTTLYQLSGNDLSLQEKWLKTTVIFFFNHLQFLYDLDLKRQQEELNK